MKNQTLNTLFHCVFNIHIHLVLVTKYRRKCINKSLMERLHVIMAETIKKWECELIEFNAESDHVHMLIAMIPKVAPSVFVNNIKTVSSRLIRKDFREHLAGYYRKPVFWSRSYCVVSCGGAPLSIIKQYIQQQDTPG